MVVPPQWHDRPYPYTPACKLLLTAIYWKLKSSGQFAFNRFFLVGPKNQQKKWQTQQSKLIFLSFFYYRQKMFSFSVSGLDRQKN